MKSLHDVAAPAKLNLFLHVVGRRPDGYHLLQSVFMLIDWHDTLHLELRSDGGLSREDLSARTDDPLPADDLVIRAARALQQATGCALGAHIGLVKRLPMQAGLGGGSSDAASCLLALNRLWNLKLNQTQLAHIGLGLGADVPFFVRGRNAWVEGIGEQIRPVALPPARFRVVKPVAGLETRLIFASPSLPRESDGATLAGFVADPYGFGRNDLQAVAQALCPDVTQALGWLDRQGLRGRMSGSGSAVFARLPAHEIQANEDSAGAFALPAGWQARDCNNLEVHPLHGWAASED